VVPSSCCGMGREERWREWPKCVAPLAFSCFASNPSPCGLACDAPPALVRRWRKNRFSLREPFGEGKALVLAADGGRYTILPSRLAKSRSLALPATAGKLGMTSLRVGEKAAARLPHSKNEREATHGRRSGRPREAGPYGSLQVRKRGFWWCVRI
jgi:hypothetical protein